MNYQKIELNELIDKVKIELKNAHYSDLSISGFFTAWNRLTNYMGRIGKTVYTAKIGMDFLQAEYGITVYEKLTPKNRRYARPINLLSDYLLHGIIFPRTKQGVRTYHPQFQILFQGYIDKKRADGFSEDTLKSYELYLSRFSPQGQPTVGLQNYMKSWVISITLLHNCIRFH